MLQSSRTTAHSVSASDPRLDALLAQLELPRARLSLDELELVVYNVAAHPSLFEAHVVDDPAHRWCTLLHATDNFDVRVLSWGRNEPSDWHDHAGSSGAFAVSSGTLLERYRRDDATSIATRRLAAGRVGSFGASHVHVVNDATTTTVSVHAYSPPLRGLTFYDRTLHGFVARAVVHEAPHANFEPFVD
jgi:hypothetical protein